MVWGNMPQATLNDLGLVLELNLSLERSGDFVLSGKWQPCVSAHYEMEKKTAHSTDPIPWHSVLLQKSRKMSVIIGYSLIRIHCFFREHQKLFFCDQLSEFWPLREGDHENQSSYLIIKKTC